MQETILIVYLVVAIALIGIILLQQGKGAEMGASFGAGGANTVFGAAGSGNVLTKTTTILAILFFAIALSISYLNSEPEIASDSILDEGSSVEQAVETPSVDAELPTVEKGLESEVAPTDPKDSIAAEAAPETKAGVKTPEAGTVEQVKAEDKKQETDNK